MSVINPWDISDGFLPPSDGKEYLYIDIEAPDFVVSSSYLHTNTSAKFAAMHISINDLEDYVEGEHVFVVYFVMQKDYPETPTRNVRTITSAYNDPNGNIVHVLAMADRRKKKYRRRPAIVVTDNY